MYNTSTEAVHCQAIERELNNKFVPKRNKSELLSDSYSRLGMQNRAQRVSECGTLLEFKLPIMQGAEHFAPADRRATARLHKANFCRDRLCPMCNWRRSLKIFGQVSQVMDYLVDDYSFIFLTLTIRNVEHYELSDAVGEIQKAWSKLTRRKEFMTSVQGYFKALEVTYTDFINNTYHPHLHVILAVKPSYFTSRDYISQACWSALWRSAMSIDYTPVVHIQKCKATSEKGMAAAVSEVAKYSVKSSDYIFNDNENKTDFAVMTFLESLSNRRLCSYGGVFDDIRKKLELDDDIDGDLIHSKETLRSDIEYMILKYRWVCGTYILFDCE